MTRRTTGKNRRNNPRAALLDVAAALGRIVSRLCSPPPPPPPPPPLPFFLSFVYLLRRETRRHRQPSELADDLLDGRGIGGADALGKVDDTLARIASFPRMRSEERTAVSCGFENDDAGGWWRPACRRSACRRARQTAPGWPVLPIGRRSSPGQPDRPKSAAEEALFSLLLFWPRAVSLRVRPRVTVLGG